MNTLIIYYSYGNNTRNIATEIKEKLNKNVELLEIEPVHPYTMDYQTLVAEEEAKMNDQEIIEIKDMMIDFSKYNRIILGTPVWWYTITPPMRSFLDKYKQELKNKTCDAFFTNGGWLGHSIEEMKEYVHLNSYVNLEFDQHTIRNKSQKDLGTWINNL